MIDKLSFLIAFCFSSQLIFDDDYVRPNSLYETVYFHNGNKDSSTRIFKWLQGTWKMKLKTGVLFECWSTDDNTPKSKSYKITERGDTVMLETVEIVFKDSSYFYVPTTFNQNEGKPVYFKMTSISDSGFIAENKKHDFPQRIIYELRPDLKLFVKIDGNVKSGYQTQEFVFDKMQ